MYPTHNIKPDKLPSSQTCCYVNCCCLSVFLKSHTLLSSKLARKQITMELTKQEHSSIFVENNFLFVAMIWEMDSKSPNKVYTKRLNRGPNNLKGVL